MHTTTYHYHYEWHYPTETPTVDDFDVIMHHNGDYSGDVKLMVPTDYARPVTHQAREVVSEQNEEVTIPSYTEFTIPFEAIKHLVVQFVASEKMSKLEQAEDNELLGL